MENLFQEENLFTINIDDEAKEQLKIISAWAKLIAIVAIIIWVLGLVYAFIGKQYEGLEYVPSGTRTGGIVGALIAAAIGIILNIYLYKFATSARASLESSNTVQLEEASNHLRTYFKIIGIICIICLAIAVLVVLFFMLGSMAGRAGG